MTIAHTTTPFFRLYKLNETSETWDILDAPDTADLPKGNGIEPRMRVFNNKLYIAIFHVTTPFVTIYTWENNLWTKLPNPPTLVGETPTMAL